MAFCILSSDISNSLKYNNSTNKLCEFVLHEMMVKSHIPWIGLGVPRHREHTSHGPNGFSHIHESPNNQHRHPSQPSPQAIHIVMSQSPEKANMKP